MTGRVLAILLVAAGAAAPSAQTEFPWQAMARRIADALQVESGERVMLRFDPATMRALEPEVAKQLRDAGATVESHPFGALDDFARRLERTDVYVWLPAGPTARAWFRIHVHRPPIRRTRSQPGGVDDRSSPANSPPRTFHSGRV